MLESTRKLRSTAAKPLTSTIAQESRIHLAVAFTALRDDSPTRMRILHPGSKLPGLPPAELALLRRKQKKLQSTARELIESLPASADSKYQGALASTLIFADYAAGTAVCIDPQGFVLTCAHCVDSEPEQETTDRSWLLFYNGMAAQTKCVALDSKRDLALLQIIAIEAEPFDKNAPVSQDSDATIGARFCAVPLSTRSPPANTPIFCIGQPGRDDLESTVTRKTTYNLVEVSHGRFRGLIPGADPQDNSEIGSLKHNAWTYWGHSGAPLLRENNGSLIGLHSSWDDQTAMRHGVPLVAIREFLGEVSRSSSSDVRDALNILLRSGDSVSPANDQAAEVSRGDDIIDSAVNNIVSHNQVEANSQSPLVAGRSMKAAIVIDDD